MRSVVSLLLVCHHKLAESLMLRIVQPRWASRRRCKLLLRRSQELPRSTTPRCVCVAIWQSGLDPRAERGCCTLRDRRGQVCSRLRRSCTRMRIRFPSTLWVCTLSRTHPPLFAHFTAHAHAAPH